MTAGWARKKVSHMCVDTHRETREKTEVSIDADVCGSWGPSLLHPTERFENFRGDIVVLVDSVVFSAANFFAVVLANVR